jgi:hypothetical protein
MEEIGAGRRSGDHGNAKEIGDAAEEGCELAEFRRQKLEAGILGDEDPGADGQGAGEGELVMIEWAQAGDSQVGGGGEAGKIEDLCGAGASLLDVEPADLEQRHGDIFRYGEGIQEERLGEEETKLMVAKVEPGGVIEGSGGLGIEPEFAGVRPLEEAEDPEEEPRAGVEPAGEEGEAGGLDGQGEPAKLSRRGAVMDEGFSAEKGHWAGNC